MRGASASRRRPARSLREWALRGGLAVAALAAGGLSTAQTFGYVLRSAAPERAIAFAPSDGRILADLAAQQAVSGETAVRTRARIDALAREALRREPLAALALTALAIDAEYRGDRAAARRLITQSDRLSRRELGTRLWLIEDAVGRGDIEAALGHYDIALRTARVAPDTLFPVLAQAISDEQINRGTAALLAKSPAWKDEFFAYLGEKSSDPAASALLFRRLAAAGVAPGEGPQAGVVNALIAKGRFDAAWDFYRTLRPGARRDRLRDPEFTAALARPSLFDWLPVTLEAGISASIQGGERGGVFDFAAPATVGGTVLQQFELLAPGTYRLSGRSAGLAQPADSRPYWQLVCADGREAGRVEVGNVDRAGGRFAGTLTVPAGCPAQTLRLIVRPSNEVGGVTGQIEQVSLAPAGRPE